jgi:hypothetical protein
LAGLSYADFFSAGDSWCDVWVVDAMKGVVISLFDYTGNMVKPWADTGYECYCVDVQHDKDMNNMLGYDDVYFVSEDVKTWMPPNKEIAAVFAFPPCTDVAVSGAKHFKNKGLTALINSLELFEAAVRIAEWSGAPYMIENPVSTVSTYWRKPDHYFHPHDYTGFEPGDNYTKKTCLWTGNGFVMPDPHKDESLGDPDDRIHKAPPSPNRANFRSATPMGFAKAVFQANAKVTA